MLRAGPIGAGKKSRWFVENAIERRLAQILHEHDQRFAGRPCLGREQFLDRGIVPRVSAKAIYRFGREGAGGPEADRRPAGLRDPGQGE